MFGPSASSGMPTTSRAVAPQQRDRAVVGRRLGEDDVARLQQVQAEELDQLQRAVAGEHAIDGDALPLGQPLAQRLEAGRRAVLQHRRAVRLERRLPAASITSSIGNDSFAGTPRVKLMVSIDGAS